MFRRSWGAPHQPCGIRAQRSRCSGAASSAFSAGSLGPVGREMLVGPPQSSFRAIRILARAVVEGIAHASYEPGLLALREGPLLQAALGALRHQPEAILVNATGRDHPRRAGLEMTAVWGNGTLPLEVCGYPASALSASAGRGW